MSIVYVCYKFFRKWHGIYAHRLLVHDMDVLSHECIRGDN